MRKRYLPDAIEERLDELLWQVAAELEPETDRARELDAERVRGDVSRWMATRNGAGHPKPGAGSRIRRAAYPWMRAAVVVLAVGGIAAAGYWSGRIAPPPPTLQVDAGDAESWYIQVARAPDVVRPAEFPDARNCTSDSWYCVQARPASGRQEL